MKLCKICNKNEKYKKQSYCNKCLYEKYQKPYFQSESGKERIRLNTRSYQRKKNGFTDELFEKRFAEQNNSCAICNSVYSTKKMDNKKDWHGDHNHKTGTPRGILCASCNTLLGRIESAGFDWVDKAKKYLQKYD